MMNGEMDALGASDHRSPITAAPCGAALCFAGLVALAGGAKPDPIPNSAVKPLSANGTKPQGLGESVAARPAKHSSAGIRTRE